MDRIVGKAAAFLVGAWLVLAAAAAAAGDPGAAPKEPGKPDAAPMMEGMTRHMDGMKKAIGELRESEKALEAASEAKDFRAAVILHLKKIDDLQASHLEHMEKMMEGRAGEMRGAKKGGCGCRCGGPCDDPCGPCGGDPPCREKHGR